MRGRVPDGTVSLYTRIQGGIRTYVRTDWIFCVFCLVAIWIHSSVPGNGRYLLSTGMKEDEAICHTRSQHRKNAKKERTIIADCIGTTNSKLQSQTFTPTKE